jgi:ADP-ribose pyrophosphatase YjhB (NUDIX family)
VPDGPWTVNSHPNRPDSETVPSDIVQQQLLARGYRLDTIGRPIHPWFEHMITDPTIGVTAGKGAYWTWGPNYTADAVVIHQNNLLLVQRKDTGDWAVPGGFVNQNEEVHNACLRELVEETGLKLTDASNPTTIYAGPIADPRLTAHAWPETTALLYVMDSSIPPERTSAGDDAAMVRWVPFNELNNYELFGGHRLLAQAAIRIVGTLEREHIVG